MIIIHKHNVATSTCRYCVLCEQRAILGLLPFGNNGQVWMKLQYGRTVSDMIS